MRELIPTAPLNEIDGLPALIKDRLHSARLERMDFDAELKSWILNMVEYEPQFRTVKIREYDSSEVFRDAYVHHLPFPYMQFSLLDGIAPHTNRYQVFYVSMTNTPVQDLFLDRTFLPPLPNIYTYGQICLALEEPKDLEEAVSLFWTMPFDNIPRHGWKGPTLISSYERWASLDLKTVCEEEWLHAVKLHPLIAKFCGKYAASREL